MTKTRKRAGVDALIDRLDAAHLERNVQLGPLTTFRIGGPADLFYTAYTADELARAILAARETGIPHFILGLGANVLIGDGGFRGLVIHNRARQFEFDDDGRLRAESGAIVADLIPEAV